MVSVDSPTLRLGVGTPKGGICRRENRKHGGLHRFSRCRRLRGGAFYVHRANTADDAMDAGEIGAVLFLPFYLKMSFFTASNASLATFVVEWINFTVFFFYCFRSGHSLSAYAELPILVVLDSAIVGMILHYGVGDTKLSSSFGLKLSCAIGSVLTIIWCSFSSMEHMTLTWRVCEAQK